jgi:diguanylate cyclase (GGDEF)-like protein
MQQKELTNLLKYTGKDPSRLIFEDELTEIYNRRFLLNFFESKVSWNDLDSSPLSLIMVDVDNFKQVNDAYGHQIGDQALVWVADLLRKVGDDQGLAIRYAGDEFMLLLPHCSKKCGIQIADRLHRQVHQEPFRIQGKKDSPAITLSIGIASASEDALSGKGLIQKADIALYYAKKIGRDCVVNASEVVQEDVFAKTAINQLAGVKMVGRGQQFSLVSEALARFTKKQSQFLIAEGATGSGKTEFLDTIRRNLTRINITRAKANGDPHEMFRPYYLISKMLIDILNQQKDQGTAIIQSLRPQQIGFLAQILPQLDTGARLPENIKDTALRKGIFDALFRLINTMVGKQSIIFLIDDLHFADEASLLVLRHLMLQKEFPIFICGCAGIQQKPKENDPRAGLINFYAQYQQQLDIQKISLSSLNEFEITEHILGLFPKARLPKDVIKEITEVSLGNPLFLSEILRKMVLEQQITLLGQQWVVKPIEAGYLPRSLEEIVAQKVAALDEESRQILDQVSTLGEHVSLSMLTGSCEKNEARVLEFIDKAVEQGLLSTDFDLNDDTVRFGGKQILEYTYSSISQDRKKELHERVGNYQEGLYQQKILPSAAPLAYHFDRSTDQEKAGHYEKLQISANDRSFNPAEAVSYQVDKPGEGLSAYTPLDPDDLPNIPDVMRDLMVAARNIGLYPAGSNSIVNIRRQLKSSIDQILTKNETLSIDLVKQSFLINGQRIDTTEVKLVAKSFQETLKRLDLKGIAIHQGVDERELEVMLQVFSYGTQDMIDEHHWERFSSENRLVNIELKQIRYAMKVETQSGSMMAEAVAHGSGPLQGADRRPGSRGALSPHETSLIRDFLRSLTAVVKAIKLYPLKSRTIAGIIQNLLQTLEGFFKSQNVLSVSRASDNLLVNGQRVDLSELPDFKALATIFYKFLDDIGLSGLTFQKSISYSQLETFVGALRDVPDIGVDSKYFKEFAKTHGLSDILFDQNLYETRVTQRSAVKAEGLLLEEQSVEVQKSQADKPIPAELFENFLDRLPEQLEEFFLEGEADKIERIIHLLFLGYQDRELAIRYKAIEVCHNLMAQLNIAYQHDFVKVLFSPLLAEFDKEKEPKVFSSMASMFNSVVRTLIEFVEYPLASKVLTHLQNRYQKLKEIRDSNAKILAESMSFQLEPLTQKLLVEDLKSGEPARQRNAAQLLLSLGPRVAALLIDIVKGEQDYRARKIAARLLQKQGSHAVERVKRLLVLEISAEERMRILDIIDMLTTDVKDELVFAMGDEDPKVREAACGLVERINDGEILEWLFELARSQQPVIATSAIKCLGKLGPPEVEKELITLLDSSKDESVLVACCRALGQIARPTCIEALSKILETKNYLFFHKGNSDAVRAAAAFALTQIPHSKATDHLAQLVNDRDPRIRQVAQSSAQSIPSN